MDLVAATAIAAGAAWGCGLNAYAVICAIGLLGASGHLDLPSDLQILTNPLIITASGFMYIVEFFVDKTPGVDSVWDALHTFVRVPAGAVLAAGSFGHLDPALQIAAFLLGGGLAASSHAAKAGSRLLINTSPEPVTNWIASVAEDVIAIFSVWVALNYPVALLIVLAVVVILTAALLPRLWHGIRILARKGRYAFPVENAPTLTIPRTTNPPTNSLLT